MREIPQDKSWDSTLVLWRKPYDFISQRCRRHHSDLFQTRLMLRKTICMMGKHAAELIYDPTRFERKGVSPGRIQKTLFGQGGVQGLDDQAHQHRKQMFMSLMGPERIAELGEITAAWLQVHARQWAAVEQVILYNEFQKILCRAVCDWCGVPLPEPEVEQRSSQLTLLFDQAGSVGPKHWQARLARKQANVWILRFIEQIRSGELKPPESTAAHTIAWHRDLNGDLLPPYVAAVELLNVLRPTVAVSVYLTFAAAALHQHSSCYERLQRDGPAYEQAFAQEVRRFYPFFPFIAARVRQAFDWQDYHFPKGRIVLLSLYSTNHDARIWDHPETFRPERFEDHQVEPFSFVPQGGGDAYRHHRCPGEPIADELIKVVTRFLVHEIRYEVPEQDLSINRARMPALPRSRMILHKVHLSGKAAPATA